MPSENAQIVQYLTRFAIDGPLDQKFVSELIAPVVEVKKKKFSYKTWTRQFMKAVDSAWAKGTVPNYIEEDAAWSEDSCIRYALDELMDQEDRDNHEGSMSLEENLAMKVKQAVLLQQEIDLAAYMATSGNFSNTGAPSYLWDTASADFLGDIATGQENVQLGSYGAPANMLILPKQVFLEITVMDQVLSWKQKNGIEAVNEAALSKMTGIPRIVIADAVYDSAAKDTSDTVTGAWVWGKDAWLLYVKEKPDNQTMHWASHFAQKKMNGVIKKIYNDDNEVTKIRYQKNFKFIRINNKSAHHYDGVIS